MRELFSYSFWQKTHHRCLQSSFDSTDWLLSHAYRIEAKQRSFSISKQAIGRDPTCETLHKCRAFCGHNWHSFKTDLKRKCCHWPFLLVAVDKCRFESLRISCSENESVCNLDNVRNEWKWIPFMDTTLLPMINANISSRCPHAFAEYHCLMTKRPLTDRKHLSDPHLFIVLYLNSIS